MNPRDLDLSAQVRAVVVNEQIGELIKTSDAERFADWVEERCADDPRSRDALFLYGILHAHMQDNFEKFLWCMYVIAARPGLEDVVAMYHFAIYEMRHPELFGGE